MITCDCCSGSGCSVCNGNGEVGEWTSEQKQHNSYRLRSQFGAPKGNKNACKLSDEERVKLVKLRDEECRTFREIGKIVGISSWAAGDIYKKTKEKMK